jgi:Tfp pilus assembly protein PilV
MTSGGLRTLRRDESGFTIVEVLVASVLLLVGMLGTLSMLEMAYAVTTTTKAREQAVALQREVVEAVRAVPYDQLTPTGVGAQVRSVASLTDSDQGAAGWTVRRRGVTYSIATGVCAVDDSRDGTGSHEGATFCASGAGAATPATCKTLLGVEGSVSGAPVAATAGASVGDCGIDLDLDGTVDNLTEASVGICLLVCPGAGTDSMPSDYKRVVVLVRWTVGGGSRYVLQSTTISNPGMSAAPAVTTLTAGGAVPVTAATSLPLTATTSGVTASGAWYVDGTAKGSLSGSGTTWTFSWPLGSVSAGSTPNADEVLDGSYLLGAKAFDAHGQFGTTRQLTVTVNRRAPYPPRQLDAGRNGSAVELEWRANAERDIEGYRVYRRPAIGSPVEVCALTEHTSCRDESPPALALVSYYVVAVDRTTAGALREGGASSDATVVLTNQRPDPPVGLSLTPSDGGPVLSWSPPPDGDPDLGDSVAYYRIYRDGSTVADRFDRTSVATELTYTDTQSGGTSHSYWVTAVDQNMTESLVVGPVTG